MSVLSRPLARIVLGVVAVSALAGAGAAMLFTRQPGDTSGVRAPQQEEPGAFGALFIHFFLGRTTDGSRPSSDSQLVRAGTFFVGEDVGLRVQTAPDAAVRTTVELRFLERDTREESAALRSARRAIRIQPGLRTYCCVRMPKEPGSYTIGVLIGGRYVTFLPVTVKPRPQQGGGLQLGL